MGKALLAILFAATSCVVGAVIISRIFAEEESED